MADDIKRYNPDTGTWDISSSGKATGIVVDDPRLIDPDLAEEGKTTESLNDVLVRHEKELKLMVDISLGLPNMVAVVAVVAVELPEIK